MIFTKFYSRFSMNRALAIELIASTFFINILALATPIFVIQVLSRYLAHSVDRTLTTLGIGVIIAIILEIWFRQLRSRVAGVVADKTYAGIANQAFEALTTVKMSALYSWPKQFQRDIIRGLQYIQKAYSGVNLTAILDVPFCLLFLLVVALLSPVLAFITGSAVLVSLLVSRLSSYYAKNYSKDVIQASMERNSLINDVVANADTIRITSSRQYMKQCWETVSSKLSALKSNTDQQKAFIQNIIQAISLLTIVLVIGIGAKLVVLGKLNIGALIGANILSARALISATKIIPILESLARISNIEKRLSQLLAMPKELAKGTELKEYAGSVNLTNLSFTYKHATNPIFEKLTLNVSPGTFVGITGPNGAGKTTLAKMLVNLLEPTKGQIAIDGINLEQIKTEWWRKQLTYLPQEITLLNLSIQENILLGNPNITPEKLNQVLELADLRSFFDKSTFSLNTVLKEGIENFPVGIRRRIALARALASNGRIIVLDEPTEALDNLGCQAIYRLLNYLTREKRTIFIFTNDQRILKEVNYLVDLGTKPTPTITQRQQTNVPLQT